MYGVQMRWKGVGVVENAFCIHTIWMVPYSRKYGKHLIATSRDNVECY